MIRTNLIRELHAIGKSLGLDHEALRDACGVSSLRELRDNELLAHIRRLRSSAGAKPAGPRLVNSAFADATIQQRKAIFAKLKELGWSDAKWGSWLFHRFGVGDLFNDDIANHVASKIIACLEEALAKGPGGRPAKEIACT